MKARLLVLGLDGASWNVIERLGPEALPNLHRLASEGTAAPLRSTTPPMTLPAWSSVLTGCRPGKHGIYDFMVRPPGSLALAMQDSSWRRVPTIHQVLAARGRSVASVLVPTTWPPPPGSGTVVSGFDSPVATGVSRAHCHPPGLYDELVSRFGGLCFADFQEGVLDEAWFAVARTKLLAEVERKRRVADWLLDGQDWDCFMIVFGESDTVAHHGWAHWDPVSPRHRPGDAALLGDVYAALDGAVGALAARADTTVICSDHGFGGAGDTAIFINRFLESRGWLRFRRGSMAGVAGERLRRLATRLPIERVVRALPASLLAAAETRTRTGDLDWSGTRAWSDEMNYAATVHLHKAGRDPGGLPVDEPRLVDDLLGWQIDGRRVVEAVHRADDLYGPDRAPGAPDLVLDLATPGGYSFVVLPSARSLPGQLSRALTRAECVGGKGVGTSGSHRSHGVLVLHGAGVRAARLGEARVEDVMPTALALLGEPIPGHVDGRVLREAIAVPARFTEGVAPAASPRARGAREDAEVRGRLRRLGYLE